jgi:hypothetical protein
MLGTYGVFFGGICVLIATSLKEVIDQRTG